MKRIISIVFLLCVTMMMKAQDRPVRSSQWLKAFPVSGSMVSFAYNGTGTEVVVNWGMDVAWNSSGNVRRGTNYIGKENLKSGRISFQPSDLVGDNLTLSNSQQRSLRSRINNIKISGVTNVILNCDHEALNSENYYGKPEEWYKLIKASVLYAKSQGLNVTSVLPFNEPDYEAWGEGSKADFKAIAKLIKEDPDMEGIRVCGGNTLNDDQASSWYNYMKPYIDEGNTHQLAGNFRNYAAFFQEVRKDGNHATADEMHNTMEAFVAAHYGLQTGIWWGYDGVARGDYCKAANGGYELGYDENRDAWAAGCVYRRPDGQVEAFVGVSERQANKNRIDIIATDRDVYYDGFGPVRLFQQYLPGDGTYGSSAQKNADKAIHIYSGADVPTDTLGGEYLIMNKQTNKLLAPTGTDSHATIQQFDKRAQALERWKISPTSFNKGGDFSYHYIKNSGNESMYLNLLNNNLNANGTFILYNAGGGDNEQYVFEYAGDNFYYIRSHLSGLYVETNGNTNIRQNTFTGSDSQKWRLMAVDAKCEQTSPVAPTGLTATPQTGSVALSWNESNDADFSSYMVLRGFQDGDGMDWTVIGHHLTEPIFLDNNCKQDKTYTYKIVAVDKSGNRSEGSEGVDAATKGEKTLLAHYDFENNIYDSSENFMDAAAPFDITYSTFLKKTGESSGILDGKNDYLLLPNQLGNMEEMTIALWVYNTGSTTSKTHLFDFGSNTDQFMYFTPNSGKDARLVLKNGGEEQVLSITRPGTSWKHLAFTLSKDEVKIYVNGELEASTSDIDIRPSDFQPALCFIGRSQSKEDPLFKGRLDDLRFYNYALSEDEIKELANVTADAIENVDAESSSEVTAVEYFDLNGRLLGDDETSKAVILKQRHADGTVTVKKVIK